MGLDAQRALGAVRLSLGYDTTTADVDAAAAALVASTTATMASRQGRDARTEPGARRAR
jgi:cysteine sulfinate desulfinase/cysteine desulfurase-like protein